MNHSEVHSYMAEYLEGELDLTKRALLDAHLDACEACSREFEEMRGTIALLRGLPDPEPPPFLAETVMRRIRAGESRLGFADRLRGWVAALAVPQVALPATALAVGLWLAAGGPTPTSLPGLGSEGSQPRTIRIVTTNPSGDPSGAQATGNLVPYLTIGEAPPAVARVPHVTINLPNPGVGARFPGQLAANEMGVPPRMVTRWPSSIRSIRNSGPTLGDSSGISVPIANHVGPEQVALQGSAFAPPTSSDGSAQEGREAQLDMRIERMVRRPAAFAADFSSLTLAEREHWLPALASRAAEIGRADEALQALRRSGDPTATQLAAALSSQLDGRSRPEVAALEAAGDASER